jgi:transcriptional regulator with XRE-family HTH domain
MTPFGQAIREMRDERSITQRQMANDLGVSPAYLSALEHGHR